MKKIRKFYSDHYREQIDKEIDELPDYRKTKDNLNGCLSIGDYLTHSNNASDSLNDFLTNNDNRTDKRISEGLNEYDQETLIHYLENAVKMDFPLETRFERDDVIRLYTQTKAKVLQAYSDVMFGTLTLHNLERLINAHGWEFDKEDFM